MKIAEWDNELGQMVERDATPEEQAEIEAAQADASTPVPQSVTMRQARLALLQAGKLANVDAAIASLPSPQKEQAQIEWEFSSQVERNRDMTQMIGGALGFTSEQLDDLFVLAATL